MDEFNKTTSQYLLKQKNRRPDDFKMQEFNQMQENINVLMENGEFLIKSVRYIISNLDKLESDDALRIGPVLLNYALSFDNVELSAISIHLLAILGRNSGEHYIEIMNNFVSGAIEKSSEIFKLCSGPLSPQVNDLIFTYIAFSKETTDFSKESGLLKSLICRELSEINESNLDQTLLYLSLLFNFAKKFNEEDEIIEKDIYAQVSQIMNKNLALRNKFVYESCLNVYRVIFDSKINPENKIDLYENFFGKYAVFFSENCDHIVNLLEILLKFSQSELFDNKAYISKYDLYSFIKPILLKDPFSDEAEGKGEFSEEETFSEEDDNLIEKDKSWKIISNFTEGDPEQVVYSIHNYYAMRALEICENGSVEMKCFVIPFLINILECVQEAEEIFHFAIDNNILEIILNMLEFAPNDTCILIGNSIAGFFHDMNIDPETKSILIRENIDAVETPSMLEDFLQTCDDDRITCNVQYILEQITGDNPDEYF